MQSASSVASGSREHCVELAELGFVAVVARKASHMFDLRNDQVQRAVLMVRRAKESAARCGVAPRWRPGSARIRRDLPIPGSPLISTTLPLPALACSQRRSNRSSSSSRPTSGDSAAPRSASNRLSAAASAVTCQASTSWPVSSMAIGSRAGARKAAPRDARVLAEISTASRSACAPDAPPGSPPHPGPRARCSGC